ncbi:MAG: CDP-glucose 4,6-dehydratase [Magnetococcales bacterium]|nr:CDP-glucose 4,6-dehydratase [Magnetococcales bacterium]NGZ28605.1 CDP-glucose 4,6-dehydratase [Magnetococcales bacterium]
MEINPNFWRGKRVFLTGHTGFKGSWMAMWLHRLGATVIGYSLEPPSQPSLFDLAQIATRIDHQLGDIRDRDKLEQAMVQANPDLVIHMAAQSLVRLSYGQPVETYATNVMGTVHLLDGVRRLSNIQAVICVTSDKCYENMEWERGYREEDPFGGSDPYSSSKGCSELVVNAYRRSFLKEMGVRLASVRAGNVIGGGDWATDRLIPDLVRSLSEKKHPQIRNPQAIRPWQHVLNTLAGYLILAEKMMSPEGHNYAEGWNFGPADEDAIPVAEVVNRLCTFWGLESDWHRDSGNHPHEAKFLKLDASKAHARLGWRPVWNLDQALQEVVSFTRKWQEGYDVGSVLMDHLADYERDLSQL